MRPGGELLVLAVITGASLTAVIASSDAPPRPAVLAQIQADPTRMTAHAIEKAPNSLSARSVLEWFGAVKRRDVALARLLTARSELRLLGGARFARAVHDSGPGLGRPVIDSVRRRGGRRAVRVLLLYAGSPGAPARANALTLATVWEGKRWRVAQIRELLLPGRKRALE